MARAIGVDGPVRAGLRRCSGPGDGRGTAGGIPVAALQLAYAAEVHNYPLVAFVALVLAVARGPWWALALAAVGAGWTHLLSGGIACGVVVERAARTRDRDAARLLGAVLLGLLPIAAGAVGKMGQDSTFSQPTLDVGAWLDLVWENTGWLGLALGVAGILGLRRVTLGALLGGLAVFGAALFSGAAAGHQRPYFILLAPILLLSAGGGASAAGSGRRSPSPSRPRGCLGWSGGGAAPPGDRGGRAGRPRHRPPVARRARRHPLARGARTPGRRQDGDVPCPGAPLALDPDARGAPVAFEYADWRYGQPRHYQGRGPHLHGAVRGALRPCRGSGAVPVGARGWCCTSTDSGGLMERVERVLRPYARTATRFPVASGLGDDHLCSRGSRAAP